MNLLQQFWSDECGAVLSAEVAAVGTMAVVGATVGLRGVSDSVNEEFSNLAKAIRGLNQSYCTSGYSSPYACTAGSGYQETPVPTNPQQQPNCPSSIPLRGFHQPGCCPQQVLPCPSGNYQNDVPELACDLAEGEETELISTERLRITPANQK